MKPTDTVADRARDLRLTTSERIVVEEAVRRNSLAWRRVKGSRTQRRLHPARDAPTADDAVQILACGWKRQAQLLDLALMIAAQNDNRTLGSV